MTQTIPGWTAQSQTLGYATGAGTWSPPAGVAQHSGAPIPPNAEFFGLPPNEIGAVRSAQTTLTVSKRPWSMAARIALGLGITATIVGGFIASLIANSPRGRPVFANGDRTFQVVLPTLIAVVVTGIVLRLTRFRQVCTYVGTHGVARHSL